jgi:transposase
MSTSPRSLDLRERVIKYLQSGRTQQSASKIFMLNASTVNRWWLRYQREGSYAPRKRLGRAPSLTPSAVENYIKTNPHFKSSDMGKHFGMTSGGAHYWLKKLGYSYKKKPSPMWKLAKKNEKDTKKK